MAPAQQPLLPLPAPAAGAAAAHPGRAPWLLAALASTLAVVVLVPQATHRPPVATAAATAALAEKAPATGRVRLEVYGMAGCPFTRGFLEGPLAETLSTMPELVDLHFHPFGNCFYTTKECGGTAAGIPYASYFRGYNQTARQCWDDLCGAAAVAPAEDCFTGAFVAQHGVTDGMVTTAWACAKATAADVVSELMPFVRCTAQRFLGITSEAAYESAVLACADGAGLDGRGLLSCAAGPRGRELLNAQGRATKQHPGVPYVVVDGQVLRDTGCVGCGDGLAPSVCQAARARFGVDTPTCQGIFGKI